MEGLLASLRLKSLWGTLKSSVKMGGVEITSVFTVTFINISSEDEVCAVSFISSTNLDTTEAEPELRLHCKPNNSQSELKTKCDQLFQHFHSGALRMYNEYMKCEPF